MRTIAWMVGFTWIALSGCACHSHTANDDRLTGMAEDLWGHPIDLDRLDRGLTVIQPISPANCGYCLFDGELVEANYFALNAQTGGRSFYQCLFNPQRDIYAYLKHYRASERTALTFPPALHDHHRNGFPFIEIFRAGEPLHRGSLWPYEETLRALKAEHWSAFPPEIVLTGPLQMAARFVHENQQALSVWVVPDGNQPAYTRAQERLAGDRTRPAEIRFEGDLTAADLSKNLYYRGPGTAFAFTALAGEEVPLGFQADSVNLGGARYSLAECGFNACFPNPHQRDRYVLCELSAAADGTAPVCNWLDYALYRPGRAGEPAEMLCYGHFAKDAYNHWRYADSLAFGRAHEVGGCAIGHCPAPLRPPAQDHRKPAPPAQRADGHYRLGGPASRFPAVAVDDGGIAHLAWEERGNLYLASLSAAERPTVITLAAADYNCWDVQLACAGADLWAVYAADRDGFERIYARRLTGGRLSDEILISARIPCDAVTPAITAAPEGVAIAWSYWQANQRHLRYRAICSGQPGEIHTVDILPAGIDYTNAWYPALGTDRLGQVWGAWNQHYPATLGVAAGDLAGTATAVTHLACDEQGHPIADGDHALGGYAAVATTVDGRRWVAWESFGWDVYGGRPQKIHAAYQDEPGGAWSLPETISLATQTQMNQTPQLAAGPAGGLIAVWSGRALTPEGAWRIYLAARQGGVWSSPVVISGDEMNARAPRIAPARNGDLWVAWHAGTGEGMRITARRLESVWDSRPTAHARQ